MSDRFSLDGRVALVTGASRGLGWAIAAAFVEHGAVVVLNARGGAALEKRVRSLSDAGGRAEAAAFDVTDAAAGAAAVSAIVERHGRLDVLVNNAGTIHRQELADFPDEEWRRVLDANLSSCFTLSRAAVPPMLAQGRGRIINIASIMSLVARPHIPAYVASKHGLLGLTRALAVELGPQGITVNAIAPGYFATELNRPLKEDAAFDELVRTRTPLGRWGEPDELAGAAVFLAADAGAYVNGAMLTVDGGMTAALY